MICTLCAQNVQNVKWIEQPGMNWLQLQPEIKFQAIHSILPRAIAMHVGSNDVIQVKGVLSIQNMEADLQNLVNIFPNTKIMFSAMFPHILWTRKKSRKREPKRKFINRVIRRLMLCKTRGVFNEHTNITCDILGLYDSDGIHISGIGSDKFMLDIHETLRNIL